MAGGARYLSGAILRLGHRSTARRKFACPNCKRTLLSQRAFASISRRGAEASTSTSGQSELESVSKNSGVTGSKVLTDEENGKLEEQEASRQAMESTSIRWDEILPPNFAQEVEREAEQIDKKIPITFRMKRPTMKNGGFWGGDEEDEFGRVEDEVEDFNSDDDITSVAHAELDLHRDMRQYQRRAAWDLPLLSSMPSPIFIFATPI